MHVALYRKYRSATFDDVCGQDHITSVLKYQSKNGRVSHAYLFCGSRGTGKTSCAKILAKAVNCENPTDGNPCGVCHSCQLIDKGAATDIVEMDAASETGVDYIRSIKEEVQYSPLMLKKKVYIIDEVHMLSESAFNALLKTLEEPPEHVVFVLATTEMHKIPATVVSRCQRFDFRRLPVGVLMSRLFYIAEKEGIVLDNAAAQIIAKQACGGMRDAISLFELCSGGGADVTEERVLDILGVSGYENVYNTALSVSRSDMASLFDTVAGVVASSKDISVFWQELVSFYRDMLIAKYADNPREYLDLTEAEYKLLSEASEKFSTSELFYQSKILDGAMKDMNRIPQNKRVIAEFALMKMCDASLDASNDALLARIEALEKTVSLLSHAVDGKAAASAYAGDTGEKAGSAGDKAGSAGSKAGGADERSARKGGGGSEKTVPEGEKVIAPPDTADTCPRENGAIARDGFQKVRNLSEVADKIGKTDPMCKSILGESDAEVSADGSKIRIITSNPFAPVYFDREVCRSVAQAFMLCKITDREAEVEVAVRDSGDASLSDELFGI